MKFEVDLHVTLRNPEEERFLFHILEKLNLMANELQALQQAVADAKTVEDSAIVLLSGLKSQLDTAIGTGNPQALKDLSDSLGAETVKLAAAIKANTPGPAAPVFDTPAFPAAKVGEAFDFQFAAKDAVTFNLGSGAFPSGLSMDPAGHVTGTPDAAGESTFSVTATNGSGTVDSGMLTLDVDAADPVGAAPAPAPAAPVV